ncbi:MAG: hypothetical protein DRP27_10315 [Thermotogae bacterium]|nr:MAG: hypothetical protein DRP27_10315 [Thermotogota bacterium]
MIDVLRATFFRSRESGFYCKEQKFREKLERIKQGLMGDLLIGKVRVNRRVRVKSLAVSRICCKKPYIPS